MKEFFRGWRRKFGILTLVMACVLTSVWMVTNKFSVHFATAYIEPVQFLTAKDGYLRWASYPGVTISEPVTFRVVPPHQVELDIIESDGFQKDLVWNWHWKWNGFEFGHSQFRSVRVWAVPFWSMVLPLTLISASLLLSKRPQARRGEASPAEGIVS